MEKVAAGWGLGRSSLGPGRSSLGQALATEAQVSDLHWEMASPEAAGRGQLAQGCWVTSFNLGFQSGGWNPAPPLRPR